MAYLPGVLAAELVGGNQMALYTRDHCDLQPFSPSNPNLSRLATAAAGCRIGERIAVYQCQDGSLSRAEFFTHDEDRGYLLRRLHDMAERFRVLFPDSEFRRLFPMIQPIARDQLCLF